MVYILGLCCSYIDVHTPWCHWGTYWCEWSMLPPKAIVMSKFQLPLRTTCKPMVLLQLESVLMLVANVTTKCHAEVRGLCYNLRSHGLHGSCCFQGPYWSNWPTLTLETVLMVSEDLLWVRVPTARRSCVCGLCCCQKMCRLWRARRLLLLWTFWRHSHDWEAGAWKVSVTTSTLTWTPPHS